MNNFLRRIRVPAGWFFFVLVVVFGRPEFWWGVILIIAGGTVRTFAAGTIRKNEVLATAGLYGMVRHPLYLGSLLLAFGFAVLVNHPLVWIYLLVLFPPVYYAAVSGEESYLAGRYGETWRKYKETVPCLLPRGRFKPVFSFEQFRKNSEYQNWLIIVAVLLILLLKNSPASKIF